ncbi:hypothetical protein [Granulicella sibirica]|uniref:Uncharacterized protein n=1 Tax=Granulicella sibirica TaxID=2479048 RepID=A0A4Q0SVC9_9BACT|nr:hypothetical protein [Granulicella sibirica]RXH54322.1 hypothetical protein GRAN_4618 [Granulicella sibirica]
MPIRFARLALILFVSILPAFAQSPLTLLSRDQASAILPPTVFYRGKSAPIQGRNSAGIKFLGDRLVLATLVDTSGYSTAVQENYQAYLITENPLKIGDQTLKPGAYGVGMIANNQFIVLDLGAHELFKTASTRDTALPRPNPLQILPDPSSQGSARLYLGRNYVTLTPDLTGH